MKNQQFLKYQHYEWVIVVSSQLMNFPAISWWEQANFQWNDDDVLFVLDQKLFICIALVHYNNSPRIDMLAHLDPLSWFRANQSLLFLLNVACLAERQQIQIS
jgi:hypothetical protein